MLLGLSIKNWFSFKDITEFSMIATREQQHGDRLLKLHRYKNDRWDILFAPYADSSVKLQVQAHRKRHCPRHVRGLATAGNHVR